MVQIDSDADHPQDPWAAIDLPHDWFVDAYERATARGLSDEEVDSAIQQAVEATVPQILDSLTSEVGATVQSEREELLLSEREARVGFEQRLQGRWGEALGAFEYAYITSLRIGIDINQRFREEAAQEDDFRFEALTRLHARACCATSEVHALLRTGHATGAWRIWRTLHELSVVSTVIGDADQELAERFLLHAAIDNYRDAEEYGRHYEELGQAPIEQETLNELSATRRALLERFGSSFEGDWGWAIPVTDAHSMKANIYSLAKIAKLGHNRPYYRLGSHHEHSGSKGASMALRPWYADGGPILQAGPTNGDLAEVAHASLIALAQVTIQYLLHGREHLPQVPLATALARVLQDLVDEAGRIFASVERALDAEEQEARPLRTREGGD